MRGRTFLTNVYKKERFCFGIHLYKRLVIWWLDERESHKVVSGIRLQERSQMVVSDMRLQEMKIMFPQMSFRIGSNAVVSEILL